MKQKKTKTEIRMFSNGRAKILKRSSNDGIREFLVKVFSDFYNDYKESLRLSSSRRTYANRREMLAERIQITPSGERRIDRAIDRAAPIASRMARMVKRSLIPFKSLRVFHPVGDVQKNYAAVVSYVRAMYDSVYEMVKDAGLPDPHPVALAAAKVACNFIITIKTAILVHKLSDTDVMEAQAEAGVDAIDESVEIDEEGLSDDIRLQINSLVSKYRAVYRLLGITQAIPATTQQIKRIVLATLATQHPELNIPDTIYAAGSFAYNAIISRLTEHILRDKIEAYGGSGFRTASEAQTQTVAQSKRPRRFSHIVNTDDAYDTEETLEEEMKDENLSLDLVSDEEEEFGTEDFIDPEEIDDYDEDYEELDYEEDSELVDYDETEYEDEDYEELDEELGESELEQAVADLEVSAQSKRLARRFASENPEGFDDYDELKRKLYSFIIRNLFRHRYFSDEKAEDETKEYIADIVDRLESIEEKLGSLEEAVEKVVEASTALVENEENSEEDDKFDLFLDTPKEEDEEEDTEDSEEESEEEDSKETDDDEEEEENSEEEEKSQSRISKRYSGLVSKKKNNRRLFSDEEEMDEIVEREKERFRKIFSDEESDSEGFFSKKLKKNKMKRHLQEGKSKRYGRSPNKKDINVVDIIFKLQKNRKKGLRK